MKRKEDEHFNLFMCIKKLDSKSQLLLSTIFSLQLLKQQSDEIGFLCPKGLPRILHVIIEMGILRSLSYIKEAHSHIVNRD